MAASIESVERLQDRSLIGILYDIYKISDSIRLPQKDSSIALTCAYYQ